jgi:Zn-dependent protease with chaperone function
MQKRRIPRIGLAAGLAMPLVFGILCVKGQEWWPPQPLPGYNIFNDQQEVWLGEVVDELWQEHWGDSRGLLDDAEAITYLQAVADRVATKSKRPELRYKVFLSRYRDPDAYVLPGGRVYITREMIEFCQNEAELAAVLSHEIAHVALRQGAKTFSRWLFLGGRCHEGGGQRRH